MGHFVLPGNPPVELTLRRSARARRISLRVSGVDGRITLTMPSGLPAKTALEFADSKAEWLRTQIKKQPELKRVAPGVELPVEGMLRRISSTKGKRISMQGTEIFIPGRIQTLPRRLEAWLKARARNQLALMSDHYAFEIGQNYSRLTLRDTRSRWGSCSHEKRLMFSWRLILAPPEVLNYVAAHEVAHLAEMNHSKLFWAKVKSLYPDYEQPRQWLRKNGASLHRYRFDTE
ncbi:MAG: SprT family zinc-dependent metalloprotease [Pseudomonadota bacterium]